MKDQRSDNKCQNRGLSRRLTSCLLVVFRLVPGLEHPESPRRLDSQDSLCSSSLTAFVPAVLASSRFVETAARFSPTRVGRPTSCNRAGLKGASRSGKTADASTAVSETNEARSEALNRSDSGLSRCSQSNHANLNSICLSPTNTILATDGLQWA